MNLAKWQNFNTPILPNFFQDFFDTPFKKFLDIPAINIKEGTDEYTLFIAAPGLKKEDFNIQLDDNILKVSSSQKNEEKEEQKDFSRYEYNFRSFSQAFSLPKNVIQEKIKAEYKNGELQITLPKNSQKTDLSSRQIIIE